MARAVNRLRNDRGDGHGRPTASVATALEARLSGAGAALVSELLLTALGARTHISQNVSTVPVELN